MLLFMLGSQLAFPGTIVLWKFPFLQSVSLMTTLRDMGIRCLATWIVGWKLQIKGWPMMQLGRAREEGWVQGESSHVEAFWQGDPFTVWGMYKYKLAAYNVTLCGDDNCSMMGFSISVYRILTQGTSSSLLVICTTSIEVISGSPSR